MGRQLCSWRRTFQGSRALEFAVYGFSQFGVYKIGRDIGLGFEGLEMHFVGGGGGCRVVNGLEIMRMVHSSSCVIWVGFRVSLFVARGAVGLVVDERSDFRYYCEGLLGRVLCILGTC